MKPVTYSEWVKQVDAPSWYETVIDVDQYFFGHVKEISSELTKQLAYCISRMLFEKGLSPTTMDAIKRDHPELSLTRYTATVNTEKNETIEGYIGMAYTAWQETEDELASLRKEIRKLARRKRHVNR